MEIRINNFRSIVDSGDIRINELNILLGRNSSGKSSFIRLFPMFKESSRYELKGPFLWFGEDYDFGGFSQALSRHAKGKKDCISFSFSWRNEKRGVDTRNLYSYSGLFENKDAVKKFTVKLTISKYQDQVYVQCISIRLDYQNGKSIPITIEMRENHEELAIKVQDELLDVHRITWGRSSRSFLPSLIVGGERNIFSELIRVWITLFGDKTEGILNEKLLYRDNLIFDKEEIKQVIRDEGREIPSADFSRLLDLLVVKNVGQLLEYVDRYLSFYFTNSFYITPLRYNFVRYMRNRDLSVDYIDPTGKNVMEYISSLNSVERKAYKSFLKDTLKVDVDVRGEDNKSIFLYNSDGEEDNIVDVGYGFSQILPIATTLWDRAYRKNGFQTTIVIEQPEVHLHPSMQAELAKLFVRTLELSHKRGNSLSLIIETHSSALINRLGRYVYNNNLPDTSTLDDAQILKLDPKNVSVLLFEKQKGITDIKYTSYDKNGHIMNWPIGFLD